ncbi:transposase family protein [Streptomyces sp. SD11]|uniref:transposase family protein n=1 Tax=Streptomyces sp. SD11 TaxID=3452209 RepID=UPI003F895F37
MGSKYTKRYTEEFKRDAIALVDSSGRTVTAVARELGISSESLRGWHEPCGGRAPTKLFCSPVTWGFAGGRGARACSGPVGWRFLHLTVRPGDHARAMSSSLIPAPVRTPLPDHELLVQLLARIPDPRRRRGVRHLVGALIAVAVCAVVAGARGFTAIGEWARDAGGAALERLGFERGGADESNAAAPVRPPRRGPSRCGAGRLGGDQDCTRRGPQGDRCRRQDSPGRTQRRFHGPAPGRRPRTRVRGGARPGRGG